MTAAGNAGGTAPFAAGRPSRGKWFRNFGARPSASVRLFCFPYAGGGTSAYTPWERLAPAWIEVCPVQLPGREGRFAERPFDRLHGLLADLWPDFSTVFDKPYALFGHSMGALIAFELARKLRRANAPDPVALLVSGALAPHRRGGRQPLHTLHDDALLERLHSFRGVPPELLQDPSFVAVLMPVIRSDFAVVDTYEYVPEPRLSIPIHAFGGVEDRDAPSGELPFWSEQTSSAFSLQTYQGGHFFIRTEAPALIKVICDRIEHHR